MGMSDQFFTIDNATMLINWSTTDPHNELNPHVDHYIGIDVGTGSARACIIDSTGDIKALATENISLWQPETGYYVCP